MLRRQTVLEYLKEREKLMQERVVRIKRSEIENVRNI